MFWKLVSALARFLFSLRYRVEIRGVEKLRDLKGGTLFLPNHPALVDPLFLFFNFWTRFKMRPLTVEYIYKQPIARPWMGVIRAVPIPNFDTSVNQLKVRRGEKAMEEVVNSLKKGDSFIIYPAGRLKSSPQEIVAGSSGTHQLVQTCPEANVVLIRTTGLWGSSFSRAIEGKSPDIDKVFFHGLKVLFQNAFLFTPRRKVLIELEIAPADFPRNASRVEFNRYLENWYNQYPLPDGSRVKEEPISLVSYKFWKKDVPEAFVFSKPKAVVENGHISAGTRDQIYKELREILADPNRPIADEMQLEVDLGLDSLNIAELISFVTRHFDVEELHPSDIDTVQSVLEVAEGLRRTERASSEMKQYAWKEEKGRLDPALPQGKTLPEAFLTCCDRMGSLEACGDDVSGVFSYKKFKRAALILADYFKRFPEERVGVMLPASVGAFLVIWGLLLARKVPVMVNWTLGPRFIDSMIESSGIKKIITSWRFLEKISHVEFGSGIDLMVTLEEVREQIGIGQKIKGAFFALFSAKFLMRKLGLSDLDENQHAVILFTSGTEAKPKGVPLTHQNLISDLRGGMQCIELRSTDSIYGFLPPFHSFGFSVVGIFSFMAGVRIGFYPDPTDSYSLAHGIDRWKMTILCTAPNFLKGIIQVAKGPELQSLRVLVMGAEKTTDEFYQKIKQIIPHVKIVEGYGATECSPIISLNRPNAPPKGVGKLLPAIEGCTIHPETLEVLGVDVEGEICVTGPNVFNGYLEETTRSPFVTVNGKQWYRTGDLGKIDRDGNITLSGRLKRFVKLGAEMISLASIEEALLSELRKAGKIVSELPTIAVCADEQDPTKPQLIVFATIDLAREEANELLKHAGFSRIVKVSSVQKMAEIPVMGTGKIDYRRLQSNAL